MTRWPFSRAAMARPVPVLPEVGSMIVPPGRRRPSRSAASIIRRATRSLIDPPGLKTSILATSRQRSPGSNRLSRTIGVSPMVSRIESRMSVEVWLAVAIRRPYRARGLPLGGCGGDDGDAGAGGDRLALLDGELGHLAGLVGRDLVLHLHGLDDADQLALLDLLPLLDEHLPHVALQRGGELVASAAGAAALAGAPPGGLAACRRAVGGGRRRHAGERLAVDPDLEALARDLDGVGPLLRLGVVGRGV